MPAPTPDLVVDFVLARDWPHLVALVLVILAALPRKLSGEHVGDGKWQGFWHGKVGLAILTIGPAALTAAAEAIWTHGIKWTPIFSAALGAILTQISPTGKQTSPSLASTVPDLPKPPLKVAVWLPLVFFATTMPFILGATCAPVAKKVAIDLAACAAGQVPDAVAGLVPNAVAGLQGTPADWAKEEASLETQAVDVIVCTVKAAIADISHQVGASIDINAQAKVMVAKDRAAVFLAKHGAQ